MTLGGCEAPPPADQARVCRAALAALEAPTSLPSIMSQQALADGMGVRLVYWRAPPAGAARGPSTIDCRFRPGMEAGAQTLTGIRVDGGELGPVRLHLLKRFWLSTAEGFAADPPPVSGAERAPEIDRTVAATLDTALAAAPAMAVYALLATAYALIFGLVGRINLAFGELAAIGSLAVYLAIHAVGSASVALALGSALLLAVWTGAVWGRTMATALAGTLGRGSGQSALIASVGMAIVLQEGMHVLHGARTLWVPALLNTPIAVARAGDIVVSVTPVTAFATVVGLAACLALLAAMRHSRYGRAWRATADDPLAAALLGIDARRLTAKTFALASALAGLAGALLTIRHGVALTGGNLAIGLKALVAALIGGIGSVPGAFLGALLLAASEAAWSATLPIEHRDAFIYLLLAAFLVLRPNGLLGVDPASPLREPS